MSYNAGGQMIQGVGDEAQTAKGFPVRVAGQDSTGALRTLRASVDGRIESLAQGMIADGAAGIGGINPVYIGGKDAGGGGQARGWKVDSLGSGYVQGGVPNGTNLSTSPQNPLWVAGVDAAGTVLTAMRVTPPGDAQSQTPSLRTFACLHAWNGNTHDMWRNNQQITGFTNQAFNSADTASSTVTLYNARGLLILVHVTSVTGAPGADFKPYVELFDLQGQAYQITSATSNPFTPVAGQQHLYAVGIGFVSSATGEVREVVDMPISRSLRVVMRNNNGAPATNYFTGNMTLVGIV